jgi:hypothetical protein
MKASTLLLLSGLVALGLLSRPVYAVCTPGESRCGADGEIQRCNSDHTWNASEPGSTCNPNDNPSDKAPRYNDRSGGDGRQGDGLQPLCTPGITRCGADNEVERCTQDSNWSKEPGTSCNR